MPYFNCVFFVFIHIRYMTNFYIVHCQIYQLLFLCLVSMAYVFLLVAVCFITKHMCIYDKSFSAFNGYFLYLAFIIWLLYCMPFICQHLWHFVHNRVFINFRVSTKILLYVYVLSKLLFTLKALQLIVLYIALACICPCCFHV